MYPQKLSLRHYISIAVRLLRRSTQGSQQRNTIARAHAWFAYREQRNAIQMRDFHNETTTRGNGPAEISGHTKQSLLTMQPNNSLPLKLNIRPIHTIPSYISKIHFNIVHPPTSWSSQWPLLTFPSISYMHYSSTPFVLHTPPISSLRY
jgi:hypothetical protein